MAANLGLKFSTEKHAGGKGNIGAGIRHDLAVTCSDSHCEEGSDPIAAREKMRSPERAWPGIKFTSKSELCQSDREGLLDGCFHCGSSSGRTVW